MTKKKKEYELEPLSAEGSVGKPIGPHFSSDDWILIEPIRPAKVIFRKSRYELDEDLFLTFEPNEKYLFFIDDIPWEVRVLFVGVPGNDLPFDPTNRLRIRRPSQREVEKITPLQVPVRRQAEEG